MKRAVSGILLTLASCGFAFAQSAEPAPQFEAADVRVSPKTVNQFPRNGPGRGGRYEIKTATMVDLIRMAYGFDSDKIVGGPNWLELDRFDITAKLPPDSAPDSYKPMLVSLLADRFKLVVHKDTKPLPVYALTAGRKPSLKEAAGTETETGCRPQSASGAPAEGGIRLMTSTNGGAPQTFNLGPGMTITYHCRNISMESFAGSLRGLMGANLMQSTIVDETGLKGNWNFDLKYSMQLFGPMMSDQAERISLAAALEKQLGLKLEEKQVPTPVLVVDSVERKPAPNPPNTAEILPPLPVPTAFEVASVKQTAPETRMGRFQMQPGGRLVAEGMPLSFLVSRAFNSMNSGEIVGMPPFAQSERYDIIAKVPGASATAGPVDMEAMAPLMLDLLKERFKLAYHKENREVAAYTLVAAKPKMKKADPASRTSCKNVNAPAGSPPGSRLFTCQNVTMEQFAERLQRMAPELAWPVADATGLEGGWDLALTFSMRPMAMSVGVPPPPPPGGGIAAPGAPGAPGSPGAPAPAALPNASDPVAGYTIFEAIEKQLGLKLEKQKRTAPVIVIDHLEQKPTEN